jgi:uncharacterized protein YcbK (DUF882 family)
MSRTPSSLPGPGRAVALLSGLALVLSLFLAPPAAAEPLARFFRMGSGELHLLNHRNNREARVQLLAPEHSLSEAALTQVDRVFGFPTREKGEHISPRLLLLLSYFADRVAPGRTIHIESGYRSPEYNDNLRKKGGNAARTSTHLDGLALDFWIEGVDGKELWELVRAEDCAGVGHYGGRTIHLDAGRPRFWEAATSGTRAPEPDENRHITLATLYDRYRPGETVRLSLSSVSTFGFGVVPVVQFVAEHDGDGPGRPARLDGAAAGSCRLLPDRASTRFLDVALPADLPPGRYRVRLALCERPFARMPEAVLSNPIELVAPRVAGRHPEQGE